MVLHGAAAEQQVSTAVQNHYLFGAVSQLEF